MSLAKCRYLLLVMALCVAFGAIPALAAEKQVSYQEYEAQLAQYKERVAQAEKEIGDLQQQIDATQAQVQDTDAKIAATWKEIYALIGSDEAGVKAFVNGLGEIEAEIAGLRALSPDDLYKQRNSIDALGAKLADRKASKIAALPDVAARIARIEGMISDLRAMFPKVAPPDLYTVVRGDNLWSISKKKEIYDNPHLWPRIYRANRDQIKDPDFIYPKQVFVIPRGLPAGYHLVVPGEWLAKIAGYPEVYGDVTKWTKIYQANKDQIRNPDLIYPGQEFLIPEK